MGVRSLAGAQSLREITALYPQRPMGPGHLANQCFIPDGGVYEYHIDNAHIDGVNGSCLGLYKCGLIQAV